MCPTLAVTTSLENALGMGMAATFVLICSNGLVSALRKVIPAAVHIPCYIVIIATFVTAIDLLMQAYLPDLSASLGIFIPLIVVNCIILGRAEAFASKNGVIDSLADGLGSGVGFTLALALIASVREIVRRFNEVRRAHPLTGGEASEKVIEAEIKKLADIKKRADFVLDTTTLKPSEMNAELDRLVFGSRGASNFTINIR